MATCAWSHLPEVAAPRFLKMMEAVQAGTIGPDRAGTGQELRVN